MVPKTPYVLQGISFFVCNKILWKTMFCPMLWSILFAIVAIFFLFPVLFFPQGFFFSAIMTPWLGILVALLATLLELLVVIMIFAAVVLLPITDKLFDQVLQLRGHGSLVEPEGGMSCGGCCNAVGILHLILSICTLPLNLIPVVGTVLWLFLNGRLYTWDCFYHYHYELKHQNFATQRKHVSDNWYRYHMFGMQAMALELIPIANIFFIFTNKVGAALWAADMEDQLLVAQTEINVDNPKTEKSDLVEHDFPV